MAKLNFLWVVPALVLTAGCAVSQVEATDEDKSAIEFSERLVKGMVNKLDKLVTPLGAKKTVTENYRSYHNSFFPIAGGEQGVLASLSSYCFKAGGSFRQGACENDQGDLLFYAKVEYTGTYAGNRETTMTVIEPVQSNTPGFMAKARELGYRTAEEEYARRQKQGQEALARYEEELRQKDQNAQAILDSGRGTRICRVDGPYVYIGYVDDISGNNIKILVQNMYLESAPNIRPGGFKSHVVWGAARDWAPCDG